MNLQFIKYFVALAETRNFTAAASQVHVVQSTFSTGIKKLEEQLGCQLFYRDKRSVLLTEAGKSLLSPAQQMLQLWAEMEMKYSGKQEVLRLGFSPEMDLDGIVPHLKLFRECHSQYQVKLAEDDEPTLLVKLLRAEVDAIFLKHAGVDRSKFGHQLLREDDLVFGVPEHHPLASREKLPLTALREVDFIVRQNCTLYDELEQALQHQNIAVSKAFVSKGDDAAKSLVAAGLGLTLFPKPVAPYPGIRYVPIAEGQLRRKIYLIWAREQAPPYVALLANTSTNTKG